MERRRRVMVLAAVVALSVAIIGIAALTASEPRPLPEGDEAVYPGHTLVSVQSYDGFRNDNGNVLLVNQQNEVVWEYDPPNAWVFDAELTRAGTVLVSMGESAQAPGVDCPERYGGGPDNGTAGPFRCIHNRVVEIDFETKDVVWEHTWYDAFPTHHEVHDADRLPSGETAIIDMGNSRAFTVNQAGEVTWTWNATEHISAGTEFWNEHVPEDRADQFRKQGPETDWTHMNDIDRLSNGNFLLSIRNFDVVLEVDPATKDIVNVVGEPANHTVMTDQHNPMYIGSGDTVLVADSAHGGYAGSDRLVEVDAETDEIVWRYDGTGSGAKLQWPRDADRLPNGNTLIADSLNNRVIEIDPNSSVVWRYSLQEEGAIVYSADRVTLPGEEAYIPEEMEDVPSGRSLEGRTSSDVVGGTVDSIEAWATVWLPYWVGIVELLAALTGLVALLGLGVEKWRARG